MVTVEWVLLCDRAEVKDGKFNIFGVHNAVISDTFELVLENLTFVVCATGEPDEEFSFTIQVFGTDQIVQTRENVVKLDEAGIGMGKFSIDRMVIPEPGRYSLILRGHDGNLLAHSIYSVKRRRG